MGETTCGHKDHEDHMTCIECGECREDLDDNDTCTACSKETSATQYCAECGNRMAIDDNEITHHLDEDTGFVDYDMDADHVAYSDEHTNPLGLNI